MSMSIQIKSNLYAYMLHTHQQLTHCMPSHVYTYTIMHVYTLNIVNMDITHCPFLKIFPALQLSVTPPRTASCKANTSILVCLCVSGASFKTERFRVF